MTKADENRLRAAGWTPAPSFRMVVLPSELGDDELILWRAPSGRTVTEREALEALEKGADDD